MTDLTTGEMIAHHRKNSLEHDRLAACAMLDSEAEKHRQHAERHRRDAHALEAALR